MKHQEILFANLIADLVVEKLHNDFAFKVIDQDIDIDDKLSINELLNDKFNFKEDEEDCRRFPR